MNIKKNIISLTPPLIYEQYKRIFRRDQYLLENSGFIKFDGSWEKASGVSSGYNKPLILEKVVKASLKVRDGMARYERDSVSFIEENYNFQLLTILFLIRKEGFRSLNIIDFGGSLGSSYFQNLNLLKRIFSKIAWNIVEQKNYVRIGNNEFTNNSLKFYSDLNECKKNTGSEIIYLSGTIQYIKNPDALISKIINNGFKHVIFDRTLFFENNRTQLCIQKVPSHIYDASYPVWIFDKNKFVKKFCKKYKVVMSFPSFDSVEGEINGKKYNSQGLWLKKIK